jgi:exodeoxyribonuclease V gamma subunit
MNGVTLDLTIATRPEDLVDALVARLAAPTDDPFVPDLVVVPNAGMREWVATQLIDRLGVLANVDFVFPAELTRRALGLPEPAHDPWRPERLAWHVLALMAEGADLGPTPWPTGGAALPPRPWTVARRVADLLERSASQRPDLAVAWTAGGGHNRNGTVGDAGLDPARGWQPATWRALRARVGQPSPAEQLVAALASDGPLPSALPGRIAVIGLSSLSGPAAAVLVAASRSSDVLVLATTSAPAAVREALAQTAHAETADALLVAPPRASVVRQDTHPLLVSWGRPSLEAATLLARMPAMVTLLDGPGDAAHMVGGSQLRRLQAAVHAGAPSAPSALDRERDGDGSVQVHACHGVVRQLEVLRDAILHAMEADPTLLPRDVAVLCADLETVAPLAVPVLGADVGGRRLPVLVTDRSATTTPPVHAALDAALALATSRLERDDVLAFLSLPVVTAALGLEPDDLGVLERIVDDLDVRWGRDSAHRRRWGYPAGVTVGTWRETFDRLLAGLLIDADGDPVGGIAPAGGYGMQDLARIGRLADAIAAVAHLTELAAAPRPMADWGVALRWLVDTLLRPQRAVDAATHAAAAQAALVRELVDGLTTDAGSAGVTHPLDVREVRAALADRMASGGSRARLRTGHVSVASLTPLRGVPFRLVAVVGVDDTLLSARGADDDDVLAVTPRVGERDPSAERRAALLDAVLAARGTLLITCEGQDVRTGRTLDLPTIVEELLDALPAPDEGRADEGRAGAEGGAPLVVRHPRHLADRRNLTVGAGSLPRPDRSRPWTFSPSALRAHAALESAQASPPRPAPGAGVLTASVDVARWRTTPLPPPPRSARSGGQGRDEGPYDGPYGKVALVELRIEEIVEALRRPARVLLRERLGVRLPRDLATTPRTIELWVDDPLARWAIRQDLLAHLMAGGDVDGWLAVRPARGGLPPGRIGRALLESLVEEVVALHELAGRPLRSATRSVASSAASRAAGRSPETAPPGRPVAILPVGVELDVESAALGTRRVRVVGGVAHMDGTVVDVRPSSDHDSQVVAAAVALLAAAAQGEDAPVGVAAGGIAGSTEGSVAIGAARVVRRARSSSSDRTPVVRELVIAGHDREARSERAREALSALVDLALRVRSGPAPLLPRSAWSIDATTDVARPPTGTLKSDAERDLAEPAVRVVLGAAALADLATQEDGPLEAGLPDAPTPVQRWSLALRAPLQRAFIPDGTDGPA